MRPIFYYVFTRRNIATSLFSLYTLNADTLTWLTTFIHPTPNVSIQINWDDHQNVHNRLSHLHKRSHASNGLSKYAGAMHKHSGSRTSWTSHRAEIEVKSFTTWVNFTWNWVDFYLYQHKLDKNKLARPLNTLVGLER